MTTPTHILGGYAVLSATKSIWANSQIPEQFILPLLLFGVFLSVAIDFDVCVTKGIKDHHKQLTHYPFFWFSIFCVVLITGVLINSPILTACALIILITSFTHLAMDLVGITMGVYLLWPFSKKEFSITPLKKDFSNEKERMNYILHSPIMWIGDSIVIILSLIKLITDLSMK